MKVVRTAKFANTAPIILLAGFTLGLILEGVGLTFSKPVSVVIFSIIAILSTIFTSRSPKALFPRQLTYLFGILAFWLIITTTNASNKEIAIERLIIYLSCMLIFFVVYNSKSFVNKYISYSLIFSSTIFVLLFLIDSLIPSLGLSTKTVGGFQLVFFYSGHNHLGDFVALTLIFLALNYRKENKVWTILSVITILAVLFYSASRSAFLSICVAGIAYLKTFPNTLSRGLVLVMIFAPVLGLIYFTLIAVENNLTGSKTLLGTRDVYFSNSIQSVASNPLLGYGPGNYSYGEFKTASASNFFSLSAHNLILEFFVENGIIGGILLIVIIYLVIKRSFNKIPLFLLLALLTNFLIDYTYKINGMLVMFFILAGLIYQEYKSIKLKQVVIYSVCLFLFLLILLYATLQFLLLKGFSGWDYYTHRSQYAVQEKMMMGDKRNAMKILQINSLLAEKDPYTSYFIAISYLKLGDKKKALFYFEQSYKASKFKIIGVGENIFSLKKEVNEKDAYKFVNNYFKEYIQTKPYGYTSTTLQISRFCQKVYNFSCPYNFPNN